LTSFGYPSETVQRLYENLYEPGLY
jgi:hypothetical protein